MSAHRIPPDDEHPNLKREVYLVAGRPRCGKGTQWKRLSEVTGFPLLEMGQLIRDAALRHPNNPAYQAAARGELVSDEIIFSETRRWVFGNFYRGNNKLFIDGVPRNVEQVKLVKVFMERGCRIRFVRFTTSDEACLARPARPGRLDDLNPIVIAKRSKEYKQTELMFDALSELGINAHTGKLIEIDNEFLTVQQVGTRISHFLGFDIPIDTLHPQTHLQNGAAHVVLQTPQS